MTREFEAPRGRKPGDVERLLHRQRNAEQRPPLAACERFVGGTRLLACAVEVTHDDRVDRLVAAFDARDGRVAELERAHLACGERLYESAGARGSEVGQRW